MSNEHCRPLYDSEGNLTCVMLSAELWAKVGGRLEALARDLAAGGPASPASANPREEWEEFKKFWDFKYPYSADVCCGNCGAGTQDWTSDPLAPFLLRSAQLGGLAVFECVACGATVRKKHFKDHVCFEFTLKGQGS